MWSQNPRKNEQNGSGAGTGTVPGTATGMGTQTGDVFDHERPDV